MFRTDPAWSVEELPVTAAAYAALLRELEQLRDEAIREADAVVSARLRLLEDIVSRAKVVPEGESGDNVALGCSVTVLDSSLGEPIDYVIDSAHAPAKPRSVSAASPVGRALLGRSVGDVVDVPLPRKGATRVLEILAITPLPAV